MSSEVLASARASAPTKHKKLIAFVLKYAELCMPDRVHWCDGSRAEADRLFTEMVEQKKCIKLNEKLRPNSYLFRSDPADVARVESKTFICSLTADDAGPLNNWMAPDKMHQRLDELFRGCMRGRTMYVLPFCMGPIGSHISMLSVQITDSPYVVVSMRIMARCGPKVLNELGTDKFFVPGMHSVGCPLAPGQEDVVWPCNPKETVIAHFPREREIYSFGSGYGGNALLGKKCLALRIASVIARDEGWLAEHMLILGAESPTGEKSYVTGAFPSQCGKTNFALMEPPAEMKGWKITTLGDDIAWIKPDPNGSMRAVNPENGFFGVCPGTNKRTSAHAMEIVAKDSIFTNVALTDEGDVWWEEMTPTKPEHLIDWLGNDWTPATKTPAAHSNSRFTSPILNCPNLDNMHEKPEGVPIKAIIFGGRRNKDVPLVVQSWNWSHGVYLGATLSSETTSASELKAGEVVHDPFALRPFAGYHMADFIRHYLEMPRLCKTPPVIFSVNWFRKNDKNKYLWPGYGENMRVLKWILDRVNGHLPAIETPLGWMPRYADIDWRGLNYTQEQWNELVSFDRNRLLDNTLNDERLFLRLHDKMPPALNAERALLISRL